MTDSVYSNPQGEIGRETIRRMNEHHRPLSEWALAQLPGVNPARILDIGCGGGMMISLLSEKYKEAAICGIDISDESVAYSKMTNEPLIREGRCRIQKASVSDIPFDDGTFDLIVSCESYFFWPDLENDLKEACRTLSKNGYLAIISEAYPHPKFEEINEQHARDYGMKLVTNERMEDILAHLGMKVTTTVVEENNWVIFCSCRTPSSH